MEYDAISTKFSTGPEKSKKADIIKLDLVSSDTPSLPNAEYVSNYNLIYPDKSSQRSSIKTENKTSRKKGKSENLQANTPVTMEYGSVQPETSVFDQTAFMEYGDVSDVMESSLTIDYVHQIGQNNQSDQNDQSQKVKLTQKISSKTSDSVQNKTNGLKSPHWTRPFRNVFGSSTTMNALSPSPIPQSEHGSFFKMNSSLKAFSSFNRSNLTDRESQILRTVAENTDKRLNTGLFSVIVVF